MKHHYGVSEYPLENIHSALDVFLYDTLDTVQQNMPRQACIDGVPPLAMMNHHLFTSLRGIFLAEPGDVLHLIGGREISLFKHVILIDRYFVMGLNSKELSALLTREEVLHRHISKTGDSDALKNPREYYITHDTLTCHHGVKAGDLRSALHRSKKFECETTARIFKMDAFDRVMLKLMYRLQGLNRHSRIRKKNLRMLQKKPPLSAVKKPAVHLSARRA